MERETVGVVLWAGRVLGRGGHGHALAAFTCTLGEAREAVGVVLWAVRVLGVVRAVRAPGGVGMHWPPLNTFI